MATLHDTRKGRPGVIYQAGINRADQSGEERDGDSDGIDVDSFEQCAAYVADVLPSLQAEGYRLDAASVTAPADNYGEPLASMFEWHLTKRDRRGESWATVWITTATDEEALARL